MSAVFEFGRNWLEFLKTVDESSVEMSEHDLLNMLGDLSGRTFLDIGCGSGLSSLAAHRLGAKVRSFDYDRNSVECTKQLQRRFGVSWPVEHGSALDTAYLANLGQFDVVYSWGVLHHTGNMWAAVANCLPLVAPGGRLHLMLYRDAWLAPTWRFIKRTYSRSPSAIQWTMRNSFAAVQILGLLCKGRNPRRVMREYGNKGTRGMSWYTDVVDWIGGYPFEYTDAETLIAFVGQRGFRLLKIKPAIYKKQVGWQGTGSYQYIFERQQQVSRAD
jgi:SAM-dependent methyltransferase